MEESRLERFLQSSLIEGEILEMRDSTMSVSEAAKVLGTSAESIVKSLVFVAGGRPVVVVVPGPSRVSEERLAEALDVTDVRLASPDEVEEYTGYRVGEVPPVGVEMRKVVDSEVVGKREVFGGGGSRSRLLKIDPRFIVDEDSVVASVTE